MSDSDHRDSPTPVDRAAVGAAKSAARLQLKSGSSNPKMNGPLYMQTSGSNVVLVRRLKRKDDGTWRHLARWFVENQIGRFPLIFCSRSSQAAVALWKEGNTLQLRRYVSTMEIQMRRLPNPPSPLTFFLAHTAAANADLALIASRLGLSFNLLALLFLAHGFIPKARAHTRKFFHLAYYNQETEQYGIGFDDAYFITFCIVLFTGLRAGTMEYVLAPFARLQGVAKRKILTRFSEQAWLLIYYSVFWTLGMVCHLDVHTLRCTASDSSADTGHLVHLLHLALLSQHEGVLDLLAQQRD